MILFPPMVPTPSTVSVYLLYLNALAEEVFAQPGTSISNPQQCTRIKENISQFRQNVNCMNIKLLIDGTNRVLWKFLLLRLHFECIM